jgi:ArsR family transcriptional regulator
MTRFDVCQYEVMDASSSAGSSGSCCPPLGDVALDAAGAETLAATLRVLADPTRLRLISLLVASESGEVCACDLPAALDRSQSTISHHLGQLVDAGILEREQRGKWAWFRLRRPRLAEIAAALSGEGALEGRRP